MVEEVGHVSVKLPIFWTQRPDLWFKQAEACFDISRVRKDTTKFNHVVANLSPDALETVSDLLNETTSYEELRDALIDRYSSSPSRKILQLLQDNNLGDRRPSQMLRTMRDLSCGSLQDTALKTLWLQRLPTSLQSILLACDENLDSLAVIADRIHDNSPTVPVNEVQETSLQRLQDQIAELTNRLSKVSDSRARSPVRRQPSSNSRSNDEICWYHRRFGKDATKCRPPCSFPLQGNDGRRR